MLGPLELGTKQEKCIRALALSHRPAHFLLFALVCFRQDLSQAGLELMAVSPPALAPPPPLCTVAVVACFSM